MRPLRYVTSHDRPHEALNILLTRNSLSVCDDLLEWDLKKLIHI